MHYIVQALLLLCPSSASEKVRSSQVPPPKTEEGEKATKGPAEESTKNDISESYLHRLYLW